MRSSSGSHLAFDASFRLTALLDLMKLSLVVASASLSAAFQLGPIVSKAPVCPKSLVMQAQAEAMARAAWCANATVVV